MISRTRPIRWPRWRGGLRAQLFCDPPDPAALRGMEGWSNPTNARARGRDGIAALAARLGTGLVGRAHDVLPVKICSNFDSGVDIGNIVVLG